VYLLCITTDSDRHSFYEIEASFDQVSFTLSEPFHICETRASLPSVISGRFKQEDGHTSILLVEEGSVLVKEEISDKVCIVTSGGICLIPNTSARVKFSAGEHRHRRIFWSTRLMGQSGFDSLLSSPLQQPFPGVGSDITASLRLTAFVFASVADLHSSNGKDSLTPAFVGLPEEILRLMQEVKAKPADYWPLPEASKRTGYSTTHFSRVFRSTVGYGFQSFVERCRAEVAIHKLLTTQENVDNIAEQCGFGATQAMRAALREYIRFTPSEIRNI
jgi:AraC-like DNA-binding protein